jgi:hypothetical protein
MSNYTKNHEKTRHMSFMEIMAELRQLLPSKDFDGLTEYNIETARSMLAMAWTFQERVNAGTTG